MSLSATEIPGWTVAADNATSDSIEIKWTNLTSLLNHLVRHYIIRLNRTNASAVAHEIADGNKLKTEIDGLQHSTKYRVEVFGVDDLGRTYKTLEATARTKNSKEVCCCSFIHFC